MKDLVNDGVVKVRKDKANSKEHKLYIDQNNLLVSVPKELDQFETQFINLAKKTDAMLKEYESHNKPQDKLNPFELLLELIRILNTSFHAYLYRMVIKWPLVIKDRSIQKKLDGIVVDKMVHIVRTLTSIVGRNSSFFVPYMWAIPFGPEEAAGYVGVFKKYDMESDLCKIFEVWKDSHLFTDELNELKSKPPYKTISDYNMYMYREYVYYTMVKIELLS